MKIEADCNIKAGRRAAKGARRALLRRKSSLFIDAQFNLSPIYAQVGPDRHTRRHARCERIRDSVRLHPALEKHYGLRPLAMICATPAVLASPRLPRGRRRDEPSRIY